MNLGFAVARKQIGRLMRKMGAEALYPKPRLSRSDNEHAKYPYLLKGVEEDIMAALTEKELARREKLQREKPLARVKILKYPERLAQGLSCAVIDTAFDYSCNLRCKHCLNANITQRNRSVTIDDIHRIAVQADEYGLAQFAVSGGEPLFFKNLDDIVAALMPEKFHIKLSTNGMFLDEQMGRRLKKIGIDKIGVSIDSISEELASAQRNNSSQFKKALQALKIAKDSDLDAVIHHVVSHESVHSKEFINLLEYGTENGYMVDILPARALGAWEGRYDLLLTDEDGDFLHELRKTYPVLRWDMFPMYGDEGKKSCGTVQNILHINKYGDVYPCAYIQIAIGNFLDEPLQTIIERGQNIKHFAHFSPRCLSGQDLDFIKDYMLRGHDKGVIPVSYKDVFTASDYIDPSREGL
jgi:MoaA/NifB/PqqE/SkfB family radical SAM enzyme